MITRDKALTAMLSMDRSDLARMALELLSTLQATRDHWKGRSAGAAWYERIEQTVDKAERAL